jgi:hypothetical protein
VSGDHLRLTAGSVVAEDGARPSPLWVTARLLGDLDVVIASTGPDASGELRTRPIPMDALPDALRVDIDNIAGPHTVALTFSGGDLAPRTWTTRIEPVAGTTRWSATIPFTLRATAVPAGRSSE